MIKCHVCDDAATAVFYFDEIIFSNQTRRIPLCNQHIYTCSRKNDGTMVLIRDLTIDEEFSVYWNRFCELEKGKNQ